MVSKIESEFNANAGAESDCDCTWTSANVQKDFVDWRKGRHRYAVWAIDLDFQSLRAASGGMHRQLKEYLLPEYARQPHVTLRICGFPGSDSGLDDDYTRVDFESQVKKLESARLGPFSIEIGAPGTFASAAYFSVMDVEGGIVRARQALGDDGPGEKDFPYVPHITFGLYCGRFQMQEVIRRLRSCPEMANGQLTTIRELVLMTYEASVVAGPLTAVCAFDLEHQRVRVVDRKAMQMLFG